MRAFDFVSAENADQAVSLLSEHGPNVIVLAGGTDILVDLKHAKHDPDVVVDITRAEDLKGIEVNDGGLRIGALVTHTQIMDDPYIQENFPALVHAAHTIGAVQTRNLGTLGGNLVTCVPSMDSGPALMALEAEVTVAGPDGTRRMGLEEFFVGPRKTVLEHNEVLLDVIIPRKNLGKPTDFLKFGLRKGQALALVNAASALWVGEGNTFKDVKISLGAVAPTVIRAAAAEDFLEGREITPENMAEAGRLAVEDAKPIDDFRASASYRRDLIAVLTKRTLDNAYRLAQGR